MKKRALIISWMLLGFALSSTLISAQDNDMERHIVIVKTENGNTMELDTIVIGDDPFLWLGDIISFRDMGSFKIPNIDSLNKIMFLYKEDLDSILEHEIVIPDIDFSGKIPDIRVLRQRTNENIIDLTDPGIISYKKKQLRGGREKIVIIREEGSQGEDINVKVEEIFSTDQDDSIIKRIEIIREEEEAGGN